MNARDDTGVKRGWAGSVVIECSHPDPTSVDVRVEGEAAPVEVIFCRLCFTVMLVPFDDRFSAWVGRKLVVRTEAA